MLKLTTLEDKLGQSRIGFLLPVLQMSSSSFPRLLTVVYLFHIAKVFSEEEKKKKKSPCEITYWQNSNFKREIFLNICDEVY